jgi:hypothetical protein
LVTFDGDFMYTLIWISNIHMLYYFSMFTCISGKAAIWFVVPTIPDL